MKNACIQPQAQNTPLSQADGGGQCFEESNKSMAQKPDTTLNWQAASLAIFSLSPAHTHAHARTHTHTHAESSGDTQTISAALMQVRGHD